VEAWKLPGAPELLTGLASSAPGFDGGLLLQSLPSAMTGAVSLSGASASPRSCLLALGGVSEHSVKGRECAEAWKAPEVSEVQTGLASRALWLDGRLTSWVFAQSTLTAGAGALLGACSVPSRAPSFDGQVAQRLPTAIAGAVALPEACSVSLLGSSVLMPLGAGTESSVAGRVDAVLPATSRSLGFGGKLAQLPLAQLLPKTVAETI
jgi:hypothetical protein